MHHVPFYWAYRDNRKLPHGPKAYNPLPAALAEQLVRWRISLGLLQEGVRRTDRRGSRHVGSVGSAANVSQRRHFWPAWKDSFTIGSRPRGLRRQSLWRRGVGKLSESRASCAEQFGRRPEMPQ